MITAILLGFLGLFLGMVGLRCTNIGGLGAPGKPSWRPPQEPYTSWLVIGGSHGDPAAVGGVVLQWGWDGQPRPQGCFTFPFALTPAPSPAHPTPTHTHQIPWLQISPLAMFLSLH